MGSNRPKNFRRRGDDGGDEIDGKDAIAAGKPSSSLSSSKPKKLPASDTKKKLLSFADEEEEEDGPLRVPVKPKNSRDRVKSSSRLGGLGSSHKLNSSTKEQRPPSSSSSSTVAPFSNVLPQAGSYTKEALLELQKNTRTLPHSRPSANTEPKVVLKGLIKPQQEQEQELQSLKDVVKQVSDLDFDEEGEEELTEDVFVNQAAIIRANKEKRRQSRSAPAPDFISLDGSTANHSAVEGVSDEEADFQGGFIGARPYKSEGVFNFGDEKPTDKESTISNFDEDEDEEEKKWEEEQLKKGIGKRMNEGSNRTVSSNGIGVPLHPQQQPLPQQQPQMYAYHTGMPLGSVPPTIGPASSVDTLPISQQAELAKKALQDNVKRLKVLLYTLGFSYL